MLEGTFIGTKGSLSPAAGNIPILLDLNKHGIDLSALHRGGHATAGISVGEVVITTPDPGSLSALVSGLGLLGLLFRRKTRENVAQRPEL